MLLHRHVRQVYERIVQLLDVARVFGGAEPREAVDEEVHPKGPVSANTSGRRNALHCISTLECTE